MKQIIFKNEKWSYLGVQVPNDAKDFQIKYGRIKYQYGNNQEGSFTNGNKPLKVTILGTIQISETGDMKVGFDCKGLTPKECIQGVDGYRSYENDNYYTNPTNSFSSLFKQSLLDAGYTFGNKFTKPVLMESANNMELLIDDNNFKQAEEKNVLNTNWLILKQL